MYASRRQTRLRLMDFPGRIPFLHQLLGCLRHYLKLPIEEDWQVVNVIDSGVIDDEWGLYDVETNKWIHL